MWSEAFYITGTSILNDDLFLAYGGQTGTTTPFQRQAAYMIAEQQAMAYLNTYLVPTTVTGSWRWADYQTSIGNIVQLPVNFVKAVTGVIILHDESCSCEPIEIVGCGTVIDGSAGIVDISACGSVLKLSCGCCVNGIHSCPDRFRIGFTAGYGEGVIANNAMAMMGLVTAADIALEQLSSCSAEYDPQITSFSDSGYSESRGSLRMTIFGGSVKDNYIARMLDGLKFKKVLRF